MLIPAVTNYDPIFVGLIRDEPDIKTQIILQRFPGDAFPARRVTWHESTATKRDFSDELARQFERSAVVTKISKEKYGPELFSHLFGAYLDEDNAGIDVDCPSFRGKNLLETVPTQKLITFFLAASDIIDNEGEAGLVGLSFDEIIQNHFDEGGILRLQQEFSSPGHYRVITRRRLTAMILSIGVALSTAGCFSEQTIDNAQIENSSSKMTKEEEAALRERLKVLSKHMTKETTDTLNKVGKEAKESIGANTSTQINK